MALGAGRWALGLGCRCATNQIAAKPHHRPSAQRPAPSAGAKRRSGFTLIEIIVVLIALVIVAAAVVPSMAAAGRQGDLDRLAARVAASARFARETAVEQQAALTMTLETSPEHLRLAWEEDTASELPVRVGRDDPGPGQPQGLPLPRAFAIVRLVPRVTAHVEPAGEAGAQRMSSGARSAPADAVLRFPADGRTDGGVVVLTDDRGRERRIVVAPETGVVHIEGPDG